MGSGKGTSKRTSNVATKDSTSTGAIDWEAEIKKQTNISILLEVPRNVKLWNDWRASNNHKQIKITYFNVYGSPQKEGRDKKFENIDFSNCYFAYSEIRHGYFNNCKFDKATFEALTIMNSEFNQSTFKQTNFVNKGFFGKIIAPEIGSRIKISAHFKDCNLFQSKFLGVLLDEVVFINSDLGQVSIKESRINHSKLHGVNMRKAFLKGVMITNVKASQADLRGSTQKETFYYDTNLSKAKLSRSNLSTVGFNRSNLSKSNFEGASLAGVSFKDSNLAFSKFNQAELKNTRYNSSNIYKSNFNDSSIDTCNFKMGSLMQTEFDGAKVKAAIITSKTDLKQEIVDLFAEPEETYVYTKWERAHDNTVNPLTNNAFFF